MVSLYFGVEKEPCFKWLQNGDLLTLKKKSPKKGSISSKAPRPRFNREVLGSRWELRTGTRDLCAGPTSGSRRPSRAACVRSVPYFNLADRWVSLGGSRQLLLLTNIFGHGSSDSAPRTQKSKPLNIHREKGETKS